MNNTNLVPMEDIQFFLQQSKGNMNMILSGMTTIMNDTDTKVEKMENQGWFKRMWKTVTGQNRATKEAIKQNHDKLNAYMSQAIAELYNRNCIDEQVMISLGTQLNKLYGEHLQLKQMLGAFVTKLNEKIDSVDNFHMLTEEINQGMYSHDKKIVGICKVMAQFDNRIMEEERKLNIIRTALENQNIITDEEFSLTDYLNDILELPVEEVGKIYLELGTIRNDFLANLILGIIEDYHFLPDMKRKFMKKDVLINNLMEREGLDDTVSLSLSEVYDNFIDSKIETKNGLVPVNMSENMELEYKENNYITVNDDNKIKYEEYKKERERKNMEKIKIVGIGGAGRNIIDYMIQSDNVKNVEFAVIETDNEDLEQSLAKEKILLGKFGMGTDANLAKGERETEDSEDKIREILEGTDMLFITAEMGQGTETGVSPVVARIAKEMGILTIAFVSKPFKFEGPIKQKNANIGIEKLKNYVDTLIELPNDKLFESSLPTLNTAFKYRNEIIENGIKGIADLITENGFVNLDFENIKAILQDSGIAMFGFGEASGNGKAQIALKEALNGIFLKGKIKDSKKILLNITTGNDINLNEIQEIFQTIASKSEESIIMWGVIIEPELVETIKIKLIATNLKTENKNEYTDRVSFWEKIVNLQ